MFARRYTYGGSVDREWGGWCSFFRCHLSINIGIVSLQERSRPGRVTATHGLRQVLCVFFFLRLFYLVSRPCSRRRHRGPGIRLLERGIHSHTKRRTQQVLSRLHGSLSRVFPLRLVEVARAARRGGRGRDKRQR